MAPLTVDRLLDELLSMRDELVRNRLLTPSSDSTAFDYGKLSGEYLGFERAIRHIERRLEEAERENDEDEIAELRTGSGV